MLPKLSKKTGSLMQKLEASLVVISIRLSSTVSVVWILQRRYGQDCLKLMKESQLNETHELIHSAVSSIGSRGWIMSTCNKPLTDSLTYPMNFKLLVLLISQIMKL